MNQDSSAMPPAATEIQWSKYAEYYDQMCEMNPAYAEMIGLVTDNALARDLPRHAHVLDVGAGTGNLIANIATQRPEWNFVHLDYDTGMTKKARAKYLDLGLENVSIIEESAESADLTSQSFDLVLTTNAIYAIPNHLAILNSIKGWLTEDGTFIAVDFGRPQNTMDWVAYIARNLVKEKGVRETYRVIKNNWEAARQNKRTTAAQKEGNYWVHDPTEFQSTLESVGFRVEKNTECYRGYSDLAVCTKQQ